MHDSMKRKPLMKKYDLKGKMENNVTTLEELEKYIAINSEEKRRLKKIIQMHPMSITRYYLSLIDPDDSSDPIRKIVVPSTLEFSHTGSFDTSGEKENTKAVGLQHKYAQTALILTTHRCMSYCRFCFRKRLVGLSEREIISNIDAARQYVAEHEKINNVLLSGGDPLALDNNLVEHLLKAFTDIDHLDFVRIGTRVPVVLPQRISEDEELLDILSRYSRPEKRVHIVTHFNHPKELTQEAIKAIDAVLGVKVPIHNQTVLLKGVSDDSLVLADLQSKLVRYGVSPYYVFQCRPVRRVTHFQIPIVEGIDIIKEAQKKMNGPTKRFRYIMAHKSGKIEIVTKDEDYVYFKYHQAKNPSNIGKFFKRPIDPSAKWLDDFTK
ncbi:MAG: KamA family radical SAM protein [Candidatus Methanofastidiosia archaeon]